MKGKMPVSSGCNWRAIGRVSLSGPPVLIEGRIPRPQASLVLLLRV
jgi:hypothetical protein